MRWQSGTTIKKRSDFESVRESIPTAWRDFFETHSKLRWDVNPPLYSGIKNGELELRRKRAPWRPKPRLSPRKFLITIFWTRGVFSKVISYTIHIQWIPPNTVNFGTQKPSAETGLILWVWLKMNWRKCIGTPLNTLPTAQCCPSVTSFCFLPWENLWERNLKTIKSRESHVQLADNRISKFLWRRNLQDSGRLGKICKACRSQCY